MAVVCTTTTTPGKPATPATLLADFSLGWDASAVSTGNLSGNGTFSFSVGENSLGVVAGLSATFTGSSYREIQFGFYANKGKVLVIESGVNKTSYFPVNGQTVQIERVAGVIRYLLDGDVVYTSAQTSDVPLVAAAMFYSGGDTLTGAVFAAAASGSGGSGSAHLQPLATKGGAGSVKSGAYNTLQPLQTRGGSGTRNSLQPLTAYGGAGAYASSVTHLQPLTASGGAGLIVPTYALSTNALPFLHTIAHGVTCEPMRVTAAMCPPVSIGADHAYGYSVNYFQPLGNLAGEGIRLDGLAQLTLTGKYKLVAGVSQHPMQGVVATLPALTMRARTGARAELGLNDGLGAVGQVFSGWNMSGVSPGGSFRAALASSATVPALCSAALTISTPYAISASVTVGGSATADLKFKPEKCGAGYGLTARSGANALLKAPLHGYKIKAGTTSDGVTVARLKLAKRYGVNARVTADNTAAATLMLPALQAAPSGQAWLVAPRLTMRAVASEDVVVAYEAYAINLATGAVTHYTHYPFDNILRFGDKYYGAASTGLFEIGGDVDILDPLAPPQPIDAHIKTFQTTFGSGNMKRVPYVYLRGRSDNGVLLGVTADEGETFEYESKWGEVPGVANHRVAVGKGIRGVYYSLDVSNLNGGSLDLDNIGAEIAQSTRAM